MQKRTPIMTIVLATLLSTLVVTKTAQAQGLEDLFGAVTGALTQQAPVNMAACEKPTHVEFFAHSGCPGFLTAILEEDVDSLKRARLPFILYVDGLITPLSSDTNYFVLGPHVMHAMPARLPHKLAMLKLRTPEIIALKARDGIIAAETVLGPIINQPGGDVIGEVKKRIQVLGVQPLPSQILHTLGHHDSRLMAIWAQEDSDGLRTFLLRIERIIDTL